jgi:hypothetical protein
VWTAPRMQGFSWRWTIAVGCSHVSGLLLQPSRWLLALM